MMQRAFILSATVLLLIFLAQCLFAAATNGQTVDETFYNGSGFAMLRYNNYRILGEHPPLIMQIASLPLLFLKPDFPINALVMLGNSKDVDISKTGSKFLYQMGNNPNQILFWERFMVSVLVFFLGMALFVWSYNLFGGLGALLSLFLFCFSPNMIAHSSLFTTDAGVTVFIFFAIFSIWLFLREPSMFRAIIAGLACGSALMSKISALVLLPVIGLIFFLNAAFSNSDKEKVPRIQNGSIWHYTSMALGVFILFCSLKQRMALFTVGPLCLITLRGLTLAKPLCLRKLGYFLLFAGWGFSFISVAHAAHQYGPVVTIGLALWFSLALVFSVLLAQSRVKDYFAFSTDSFIFIINIALLVILVGYTDFPKTLLTLTPFQHYFRALSGAICHSLAEHRICVEGSFITCDWRYFIGIIAIKTPLATLILSLLGSTIFFASKRPYLDKLCIGVFVMCFFLAASFMNRINIGVRHVLPLYPFLFLLSGAVGCAIRNQNEKTRKLYAIVVIIMLLQAVLFSLRYFPDYIPYFNEIVGSPAKGAWLTADSNLNWGQDNRRLAEFVLQKKIPFIKIASETENADVYNYYKIPWGQMEDNDWINPEPGFYAIGIARYTAQQRNPSSWFYGKQPTQKIGTTFYAFEIRNDDMLMKNTSTKNRMVF